jgi:predicted metal-dependent RNase
MPSYQSSGLLSTDVAITFARHKHLFSSFISHVHVHERLLVVFTVFVC